MLGRAFTQYRRAFLIALGAAGLVLLTVGTAGATPLSITGTLGQAGQYSRPLGAYYPGDQLKLSLTASSTVDFACGAGAGSTASVWSAAGKLYPKRVTFVSPAGAPVFVSAFARSNSGAGAFKMLAYTKRRTALAVSAVPSTVKYGYASAIRARLTTRAGATSVAGQSVKFYSSPDGRSWKYVKTVTSTSGTYSMSVRPKSKTHYRAVYGGTLGDEGYFASKSRSVAVTPKVYLSGPTVPKSMTANKTYTLSGYLKPRHTAGATTVRIQAQFFTGTQWVSKRTFYAKNSNYSSYTRYSGKVALPTKGRWRLRAYAPADSKHAATAGTWRYTSVPTPKAASVSVRLSDSTPAQGQTVNIYAKVKDRYGKVIPNAKVTMTAQNNGVSRTRVVYADASGVALWAWCP